MRCDSAFEGATVYRSLWLPCRLIHSAADGSRTPEMPLARACALGRRE
jgi:hypothetical protein